MGFAVKEWYSQAPIRGRDIFCADAKEHTGEQLRVPCVQIIYGLYSSNRHRRIGALLSGTDTSAIFVLGTRSTKDFWLWGGLFFYFSKILVHCSFVANIDQANIGHTCYQLRAQHITTLCVHLCAFAKAEMLNC